ncbi:hypothetical protein FQR65_LT08050 [Abscondita terminalis]|nr:hypothetical protein FQR65_LT08050 [Abscondita terminalis]
MMFRFLLLLCLSYDCISVLAYESKQLDACVTTVIEKMFKSDDTLAFIYDGEIKMELPRILKNPYAIARSTKPVKMVLNRRNSFIFHVNSLKGHSQDGDFNIHTEKSDIIKVHTGDPYHSKNDCGFSAKVLQSQVCNKNVSIKFNKTYQNLNKCRIIWLSYSNDNKSPDYKYYFNVLSELAKKVNGELVVKYSYGDLKSANYTHRQPISIIFGINTLGLFDDCDISHPLPRERYIFIVRGGRTVSPVTTLFSIFNIKVWILIFAVFLITSFALWIVSSLNANEFKISEFWSFLLDVYLATIWGYFTTIPTRVNIRYIMICYLIYYIHIQTGFNSNLTKILTTPQFDKGITNLEELIDSNITIYAAEGYRGHFVLEDIYANRMYKKIKNQMQYINFTTSRQGYIDFLSEHDCGILDAEENLIQFKHRHVNVIDASMVMGKFHAYYMVYQGTYFTPTLGLFMSRMEESGILRKDFLKSKREPKKMPDSTNPVRLNLEHLLCAFVLVMIGYLNPKLDSLITSVIDKLCNEDDNIIFVYDNIVELELPAVIKNAHVIVRPTRPMRLFLNKPNLYIIHLSSQETLSSVTYFLNEIYFLKNGLIKGKKFLIIINENNLTDCYRIVLEVKFLPVVHKGDFFHIQNACGRKANVLNSECYNQNITMKYVEQYRNIHGCKFGLSELGINRVHPSFNYFFKLMDDLGKATNGTFVKNQASPKLSTFVIFLNTGLVDFLDTFDLSYIAIRDQLHFVVKAGEEISPMKILFIIFTLEVWICIVTVYIITSTAVWFITSIYKKELKISELEKYFLEVFSATIWGSVSLPLKKMYLRCIFICYLIYHIHIQTGFTSNLVNILTTPQFEHGITNLEELAAANLTIYSHLMYRNMFNMEDKKVSNLVNIIKTRTKFLELSYRNYSDLLKTENCGLLLTELEIEYLQYHFLRNVRITIIKSVKILKDKPPIFGLMPGHYFTNTFNRFVSSMEESGITIKYLKEEYDVLKLLPELTNLIPLNMKHLLCPFVILAFGLIFSSIIFCLEIVMQSRIHRVILE